MIDTALFRTRPGALAPAADARNAMGSPAYAYGARHRLAQLAVTGCLGATWHADADTQLDTVLALAAEVDAEFIARTALYARRSGRMKDLPALLAAVLAVRDVQLLARVFDRVIDNGKQLRNFVQILRSGAVGRKSLGSRPKKLVQRWLLEANETRLLHAAVGNAPSLADVVKMVHPKPAEAWRAAWFAWLIGKPHDAAALPPATLAFERFKQALAEGSDAEPPELPFQLLDALPLTTAQRAAIARRASWQTLRQGLNTLARQGVFALDGMADAVAARLRDAEAIRRAGVLPYQLMATYLATGANLPEPVRAALHDAMEVALGNVPRIHGRVVVCPDVSGSMASPVSGWRGSATSTMRCIDVAALVAAALLRRNRKARVLPFEQKVVGIALDASAPVLENAARLAAIGGGGTCVSAPIELLNAQHAKAELVVIVSDNESWVDATRRGATETMAQWNALKRRCPQARLVCIDLQPGATTQALERADVLNVGGFSDAVFDLIAAFAEGRLGPEHWVGTIEEVALDAQ
ncbi:vWA domain-containing protein [Derxia lacustris]|uniref:vWA domain-containing protein n=1 Tax=Derxia lacustris TaxID=764842 RepID=UPI000A176CFB|nr:RNA-binding protein [Derxia lacustris]